MTDPAWKIAVDYGEKTAENARVGMMIDLQLLALKENNLLIHDWLEEQKTKLLAKTLKEL